MLLFKRILNFKKETAPPGDKRQIQRHTVGHPFPFKAIVTLLDHDEDGKPITKDERGQDWAGRLVNLSETGASIQLHSAAVGHRGESCRFRLSLDKYVLDMPGTIAHFRTFPQYMLCGFSCAFPDFETQKAYLQLLEPVSIGAALAAVDTKKVRQDADGLRKEQFSGGAASVLDVWRLVANGEIHSFDFRMNDYGVRWSDGMTEVEPYGVTKASPSAKKTGAPFVHLSESQLEEVRWLFCLAVPNLARAVPSDIRKFLTKLVA